MSYFRVEDNGSGLDVFFYDVQQPGPCTPVSCANFVETQVATGLNYTSYHNLKLVIDFRDGPANDLVRGYVNGNLVITGTTWEDYFRYDPEASADPTTHTVDSLLMRVSATAYPDPTPVGHLGAGYLIDNLSLSSGTVPPPAFSTTVVQASNLTAPGGGGWLFYDDNTDAFDNTPGVLGSFVSGPAGQPLGSGSAEITIPVTGRTNISTYQFAGTPLASITDLGFSAYNTLAGAPAYMVINVDFDLTDTWQRRLVFVPTGIVASTWQTHDALQGGSAMWVYSGTNWPTPLAGPPGPVIPGTTAKSWNTILAQYPNARIRVSDAHVGIRVGNPGPVETSNIDRFVFGTDLSRTLFDFEPTLPCTTTCYVNDATGNDLHDGATTLTPKKTIQAAVNVGEPGAGPSTSPRARTMRTLSFTQTGIQLIGAGIDQSIIVGPIGGAPTTVDNVYYSGVLISGFTITRAGNNPVDWNNPNLNSNGISFGTGGGTGTIQNSKITGNRNGILAQSTTGLIIQNNIIDNNRTGIHLNNVNTGTNIHNNFITNNWTMGVLIRSDSVPTPNASAGILINNNHISGNWYSQIEARAELAATVNAENNWFGTISPNTRGSSTSIPPGGSGEEGYATQIPVQYGGTDTNPGGAFSIVWEDVENVSNPVDFTPWLCSGNDTSVAIGFQPQVGCGDIVVTTNVANVGDANVTVQVIANSVANLYGVQAYLQYDSSKLNLSNIALGPGLLPEVNVATSQPGNQINFQFSQLSPTLPVTGSGIVLATLSFTATAPGVANIEFRPSATTLFSDNNGFSIGPATKTNGSITVSAPVSTGSVTGNILLQARSNHSGATAQIDPSGGPISPATTSTGAFTISSVSIGAHPTLQAVMLGYLKAVKPFTVAAGVNPAGTVTLLGGDANMDNTINILDLSFIAARYLQTGPVYAPVAPVGTTPDINGDNVVNILDLSVTAANYLKTTQVWP
ncbi:MAG: right-handed parallel beta-helix repeat-containing protein [Dehalococcoidia bacterium]|nr:right-handed parallel beta-helix repeat-containing protein [Dehalococcoidia bacterium]